MTNEGEGEAFGDGELCPIDVIKGQEGLCVLGAFEVNTILTEEMQRIDSSLFTRVLFVNST